MLNSFIQNHLWRTTAESWTTQSKQSVNNVLVESTIVEYGMNLVIQNWGVRS